MVPNCGDLTPCLSRKFARLGILVCDLYLTYHTEHILIFLAHYCNNRISVSNCILEASAQFLYNMYNSHNGIVQTCFMNAFYECFVIGLKIAISEPNIVLILLHQHVLQLCQVFVLLCQLKSKQLVLTICFSFCLQDPTSHF